MELVKTRDGSYTLYSEDYDETYHSISGALEEAEKKFAVPCGIKEGMRILDIGFGLGYNAGMAIEKAGKNIEIISLEKDEEVLKKVLEIKVPAKFRKTYDIIKIVAKNREYSKEGIKIRIILGDATKTIKRIRKKFDAVFLDAFSPPKNPELWSIEFFDDIKKRMDDKAILATYSCARIVRDNLKTAGFYIKDGPIVGRRAPGTLARIKAFEEAQLEAN